MQMTDILDIAETVKQYEDEWLLIEVIEADEFDVPTKGRLLCHSKSRDEIHRVAMNFEGKDAMITYSGDPVPADVAVVL